MHHLVTMLLLLLLCVLPQDNGISVRKRAIKTLWDCCVHCPGFTRRPDAVVAILQRAGDHEQAMQTLVTRICSAMWFDPCAVVGELL
jgi:cohesin loading factor subunit SCC2